MQSVEACCHCYPSATVLQRSPQCANGRVRTDLTPSFMRLNPRNLMQSLRFKSCSVSRNFKIFAQEKTSLEYEDGMFKDHVTKGIDEEEGTLTVKFLLQRKCKFGQRFSVVGSDTQFGSWDPKAAIPLVWSEGHIWSTEVTVPAGKKIEYKFILIDRHGKITWQPGSNRVFETPKLETFILVTSKWEKEEQFESKVEDDEEINLGEVQYPDTAMGSKRGNESGAVTEKKAATKFAFISDEDSEHNRHHNDDEYKNYSSLEMDSQNGFLSSTPESTENEYLFSDLSKSEQVNKETEDED